MATPAKSRTNAAPARPRASRAQRTLLFMMGSAFGLAVIAIILILIKSFAHIADGSNKGFWNVVLVLPAIALPIGLLLVFAVLIVSIVQRGRASRDA